MQEAVSGIAQAQEQLAAERREAAAMGVEELLLMPWRRLGQYPLLLGFVHEASVPARHRAAVAQPPRHHRAAPLKTV